MTIITEIRYILDPTKEHNACFALEEAISKERDGWEWKINTTTKSYEYIKRRSVTM